MKTAKKMVAFITAFVIVLCVTVTAFAVPAGTSDMGKVTSTTPLRSQASSSGAIVSYVYPNEEFWYLGTYNINWYDVTMINGYSLGFNGYIWAGHAQLYS